VDSHMSLAVQELRTERSLLGDRETQGIAVELDGSADVVHEDRNTVQGGRDGHRSPHLDQDEIGDQDTHRDHAGQEHQQSRAK
jgi:hypothetical protein